MDAFAALNRRIISCESCPRLRAHCQHIAQVKRAAYRTWDYWARPVPNFGLATAGLLIVGLAPGAHGANRTGRMFTGDKSGEWLYRALHRAGFASQASSTARDDGLELADCAITAAVHCAPPDNLPTAGEFAACSRWLAETLDVSAARVILALGGHAWNAIVRDARRRDWYAGPTPRFAHGAEVALAQARFLLGSYHVSQQNTSTKRLTEPMLDAIFARAKELLAARPRNG